MIVRSWSARAAVDRADVYTQHFSDAVLPKLESVPGFVGVSLLRRDVAGQIEFVVLTYWESMEAVRRFAGPASDVAVVDAEARAALLSFDETVRHYEVVTGPTNLIRLHDTTAPVETGTQKP